MPFVRVTKLTSSTSSFSSPSEKIDLSSDLKSIIQKFRSGVESGAVTIDVHDSLAPALPAEPVKTIR